MDELDARINLENYLYTQITLTKSTGIQAKHVSKDKILLSAPIEYNYNHIKTAFGGSLYIVATLACWSLLHVNLQERYPSAQIVIHHSHVEYPAPIKNDFQALCLTPEAPIWERFFLLLEKKHKARILLHAKIYQEGILAVDYQGSFVVINP